MLLNRFLKSTNNCASNLKQEGGLLQYTPLSVQAGMTQVLTWQWRQALTLRTFGAATGSSPVTKAAGADDC